MSLKSAFSSVISNPLVTHPMLAGLYAFALTRVGDLFGLDHAPIIAAVVVSTFYYGREAGQREHDLKHMSPPTNAVLAAFGSHFIFKWSLDNLVQWLVAAGSTAAVAAVLTYNGH